MWGQVINQAVNDYRNKDHPHACGDKLTGSLLGICICGSSPCVWGQVKNQILSPYWGRIIPMRVGTSGGLVLAGAYNMDHPHACGDKCSLPLNNRLCSGSSPCVWGQESPFLLSCRSDRIIPMRVGTRVVFANANFFTRDHPHACGDK